MKKKLCALLALSMLLCLLPALAMAADGYVRVLGGEEDDHYSYDKADRRLTITKSGLTIVGASPSEAGVLPVSRLMMSPNNEVTLKDVQLTGETDAISVLEARAGATVNIEGHTVLRGTLGGSYAVSAQGDLTINVGQGAKLEIRGNPGYQSAVNCVGDLKIAGDGGEVSIIDDPVTGGYGIWAKDNITISASNVTINGGDDSAGYPAIRSISGNVTISGSNIHVTSCSGKAIEMVKGSLILRVPAQESADGVNWTALDMNNPNHTKPYFRTAAVSGGVAGVVGGGQSSVPRTGDGANVALWMALLAGSAAAMCAISHRKRKV